MQKAIKKEGRTNPQSYMYENIMNMDDSEDEDFEAAATTRVNEAIQSILVEEEEETGVPQYGPAENLSVFYRYTEEGAVREDPDCYVMKSAHFSQLKIDSNLEKSLVCIKIFKFYWLLRSYA